MGTSALALDREFHLCMLEIKQGRKGHIEIKILGNYLEKIPNNPH